MTTAPTFAGLTRTRRVVSCHGDGAKAIPVDPSFVGFAGAGVYHVHVCGDEIVAVSRGLCDPVRVLGRVCVASVAPSGETGGERCNPPPAPPAPFVFPDPPVDRPRPPATLPLAPPNAPAVALASPDLSVEIVGHTERPHGVTTLLALAHRQGGRGTFELRRTWGETFLQDFDRGIPYEARDLVQAAWECVAAADAATIVAGKGAP